MSLYERAFYWASAGFIGWALYLAGRALTYGASGNASRRLARVRPRCRPLPRYPATMPRGVGGVADDVIVCGLVGSLTWTRRRRYSYGLDLVRAASRDSRRDVGVVVVGCGSGLDRLRAEAGD